jgi:putative component of membrane protein insertase Oxa1/YidC/SpoIIIJ protein YidD
MPLGQPRPSQNKNNHKKAIVVGHMNEFPCDRKFTHPHFPTTKFPFFAKNQQFTAEMSRLSILFMGLCMAICGNAVGQNSEDQLWVRRALLPIAKPAFDHTSTKESMRFGQKLGAAGFSVYKTCISSQDFKRCNFTISCSEFCLRAIQKHGFVAGMVMGMDRYSRCHIMHRSYYPLDRGRGRSIDPIR